MPARTSGRARRPSGSRVLRPAVVAAVGAVAAVALAVGHDDPRSTEPPAAADRGSTRTAPRPTAATEDPLLSVVRRDAGDATAKGAVDAPVVIVAYSDFQCPFCGQFARDTEPLLEEEYVDEGLVRIEWRDFPYLGRESTVAARAARAAGMQDAFWPFHDALYAEQHPPNSGTLTEDYVVDLAGELGLDEDRFGEDLRSDEVARAVQVDFEQGQSIGVTGTPAFLVNGRPVMGAQPVRTFRKVIEESLAAAGAER